MLSDLRYAARVLRRSPGYTSFAVLMLAAGIASLTAVVSVTRAVLWNPPPYRDPAAIVEVENRMIDGPGELPFPVKAGDYLDYRSRSRTLREWALFRRGNYNVTGDGDPERVNAILTTASAFHLLGTVPSIGRTLRAEEEQPGKHRVVVLSHGFWTRRFGADPLVLHRTLQLDGAAHAIVGVMPAEFDFPAPTPDLWLPLVIPPKEIQERFNHLYRVWARLAPGATAAAANDEIRALAAQFRAEHPRLNRNVDAAVLAWNHRSVGTVAPALRLLAAAVLLLLLLVCANIANLMIVRLTARTHEFQTRAALGGAMDRLLAQLFVESALVAAAGGVLGIGLSYVLLKALVALAPQGIARLDTARLDPLTLGVALLVTLATAILFGLLPAYAALRGNLVTSLRTRGGTAGAGAHRARQVLAVAQLALAAIVLTASGLLLRSFANVLYTPLGFDTERLLTLRIALPPSKYENHEAISAFFAQLLERVQALPGVERAAVITNRPLDGSLLSGPVQLRNVPDDQQRPAQVDHRPISPDYFRTMGIPLLQGREFTHADSAAAPPVVIIDTTVARIYFPGQNPIGKVIQPGSPQINLPWSTIVGVVGPIHNDGPETATRGQVYAPLPQRPRPLMRNMGLVVKVARGKPEDMTPAIQAAVRELDRDQPIFGVATMEELLARSLAPRRFALWLLGLFSIVCFVLSGLGLYAVISYAVTQRNREIGVRMALGAAPSQISRLFLRQGAVTWLVGLAIGLAVSAAIVRLYSSLLYATPPFDALTLAGVALGLGALAFAASYVPARRAARLDPSRALHAE
ncbi:MAG: ABC transporter permease [Bryobacteraceae bacterium]|nr:ABC transporter permease [Bryobacteraceae bacterium]